jgi:hypothetical protein
MDKNYIQSVVQKIVDKQFTSSNERRILPHDDRIQFRCPYCHEGKTKSKKRGNLYYNRLFYICFRCGQKNSFGKLAKDFDELLDPDKKLEMIQYLDSVINYSDIEDEFLDARFDDLINMEDLEEAINKNVTPLSDFKPVVENSGVYKYLVDRGITPNLHKDIYQAKFWMTDEQFDWVIVMLNRRGDKILGLQIRNLKRGKRRMFMIYNYENILEWVSIIKGEKDIDMSKMVIYNKLSYYFNILNVDFSDVITVFEGYLDSLFFPNSIGLVGVNTDYKIIENNGLDIRYFFDNDEAGYKKSEEKLKNGFPVFLWSKLFNNIVSKKNSNDPDKLYHRINKIKDINKLSEMVSNPYSKLELPNYFSNDIYDLKWMPKLKKVRFYDETREYNNKFKRFDNL